MFEYPFFFDKENPLSLADVDCIKVKLKSMVSDDSLLDYLHQTVAVEEEDTYSMIKQMADSEVKAAFNVLLQLRVHR